MQQQIYVKRILLQAVHFYFSLGKNQESIKGGQESGPLVLFNKENRVMILSSYKNFMAHNMMYNSTTGVADFGIIGGTTELPVRFQVFFCFLVCILKFTK